MAIETKIIEDGDVTRIIDISGQAHEVPTKIAKFLTHAAQRHSTDMITTLATENEALHARVAELEAERDQWKEAAISENKLSVERWEEVAKWKHDYFAMRDTLLDIPEYVNWVTDGSDYENVTAPADDSEPCSVCGSMQGHRVDCSKAVKPLGSEPVSVVTKDRYVKCSWSACEDYDEYHQTLDALDFFNAVFTSSDEEAVDNDVLRRNTLWRLNSTPTTTESAPDA